MSFTIIIWILVFFGIFYFLAIRPQRRQKQQHSEMVSMLKKGDEVVTIGGMFGTVTRHRRRLGRARGRQAHAGPLPQARHLVHHEHRRVRRGRRGRVHRGRRRGRDRRGRRGASSRTTTKSSRTKRSRDEADRRDARRPRRTGGSQGVTPPSPAPIKTQRVTTSPADAAGPVPCRDSCLRPELRSDVDSTQG